MDIINILTCRLHALSLLADKDIRAASASGPAVTGLCPQAQPAQRLKITDIAELLRDFFYPATPPTRASVLTRVPSYPGAGRWQNPAPDCIAARLTLLPACV